MTEAKMTDTDDRIAALTARMLKKKLYVVLSMPLDGGGDKLPMHLPAHLEYMIANEKKGIVFASLGRCRKPTALSADGA